MIVRTSDSATVTSVVWSASVERSALPPAGPVGPCPLPAGVSTLGQLTSSFVDGPRLLSHLAERRHSGALIEAGGERVQVAVLHQGAIVALVAVDETGTRRLDTLTMPTPASQEIHDITVSTYRPEIAVAIARMINLPVRFRGLPANFVDFPGLLAHLGRERASGAVRVIAAGDVGVVLLRDGVVLGAYSGRLPELDDPEVLFGLAAAPDAELDVHTTVETEMELTGVPAGDLVWSRLTAPRSTPPATAEAPIAEAPTTEAPTTEADAVEAGAE
ncbi:MAG: hypothetical protein QOE72_766 [Chloroflexota bacterium]|jgi:hypothetical protein|nr:hypothetical protein [Chloroflexota bacterium]